MILWDQKFAYITEREEKRERESYEMLCPLRFAIIRNEKPREIEENESGVCACSPRSQSQKWEGN